MINNITIRRTTIADVGVSLIIPGSIDINTGIGFDICFWPFHAGWSLKFHAKIWISMTITQ